MSDKTTETAAATPSPVLGCIEGIFVTSDRGQPMQALRRVSAVAGKGLEGDRYFFGRGSFSRWPGGGRAVSLIAAEAVEAILAERGIDLSNGRSRRNLVTRGVYLDQFVGKRFQIGNVLLYGDRLCAPCRYLERIVAPGLYETIKGRGGLRADILGDGVICAGDEVVTVQVPPAGRRSGRSSPKR